LNKKEKLTTAERHLRRDLARALRGFRMIDPGDRILVAMSGGMDSYALFHLLQDLARRAPVPFSLVAVHVHQGQPGHDPAPLVAWLQARGAELHVEHDATYPIVMRTTPPGKSPCSMCCRLRRAILYRGAKQLGCTKVALGHHREDTLVTLLLNLTFSGQLKAMPPKLLAEDGENVVIRPLLYCAEAEIRQLAVTHQFPVLPKGLCGPAPDLQRQAMGQLLDALEARHAGAKAQMLAAVANVRPTHLLDVGLWERLGLPLAAEAGEGEWGEE